ncbi:Complement C2 [Varanus komodoensis]|nr:Complement C2 [Varanus komodoensis]
MPEPCWYWHSADGFVHQLRMLTHHHPQILESYLSASETNVYQVLIHLKICELELLSFEKVPAQFLSLDNKRMNVQIKTRMSRPACISGAAQEDMIYSEVSDVSEVVTDRFLCSGQDNPVEAATCKGESGGSLFVERKERHFQVGVISWGTYDPCKRKKKTQNKETMRDPPPHKHKPRDFYISLFSVQDWLRRHLSDSLKFIPMQ